MLFAAGEGKRMRPLSLHTPKPLLPVAGTPLIVWHLRRLAQLGVERVVINVNYLGEQIMQALGDGSTWGLQLVYSPENSWLETGGGLLQALPLLGSQPFWLLNGDVWCSSWPQFPPPEADELAFIWLVPNPPQHPHGDFYFNKSTAIIANQPFAGAQAYTFTGISRLHPQILTASWLQAAYPDLPQPLCAGQGFKLAPLLRTLVQQQRVSAGVFTGDWVDVGTPQRLAELNLHLSQQSQA